MKPTDQDTNAGTTAVREGYHFDEAALERWMARHVGGFSGSLRVSQFKGGQSNPTYKLEAASGAYVLRRKPSGLKVQGAHAIEREARIMTALNSVNFPVPKVHGLCEDDMIIGSSFYVMDMVEGRIFWDASFPDVPDSERASYFDAMNATIALLHSVDYNMIGLADYGRPSNYVTRQINRWTRQYLEDTEAGRNPDMDLLIQWLPAHVPEGDETSIVHGDYRCDNMIFHPTEPRVIALLDWELSTLGHPLADFAYHGMMYRMPPEVVAGLHGADIARLQIPSEADYIANYCARTGRVGISNWQFYIAFNFFRLAAIAHGIKGRVIRGTAASAHAKDRVAGFPILARIAREAMEQCA